MKVRGLYTALVTPFNADGSVNYEQYRTLVRFQIEAGADGIVALGTTGEAPTLTSSEKKQLIGIAKEETKGHIPLIVGTGSYSTKTTIEYSQEAESLGADGLLVVTPYYNKPTPQGLYLHFKALNDAVNLPIILYAHQGRTAQNVEPETIFRIAELPKLVAVKVSATPIGQIIQMVEMFRKMRQDFTFLSGDDMITLALMGVGGHGTISVASNLIPMHMKAFIEAGLKGDSYLAQNLFYEILPIMRALEIETNPIPVKAAMNLAGMSVGGCRLPLCDLTAPSQASLAKTIKENKQLIDRDYALYRRAAELALAR